MTEQRILVVEVEEETLLPELAEVIEYKFEEIKSATFEPSEEALSKIFRESLAKGGDAAE